MKKYWGIVLLNEQGRPCGWSIVKEEPELGTYIVSVAEDPITVEAETSAYFEANVVMENGKYRFRKA